MQNSDSMALAWIVFLAFLTVIGMMVYLLPAIIAKVRGMAYRRSVFWLNLLLGWSVVGWLALGLWAIFGETTLQVTMDRIYRLHPQSHHPRV